MPEEYRYALRLPQQLAEALQRLAEREHRSLNAQIIVALERYVREEEAKQTGPAN